MRHAVVFLLCAAAYAQAPGVPQAAPHWRQTFSGLMGRPPGSLTARDLQQMETELALAGRYCTGLTPGDYEANQALVRQMAAYLATVQVAAGDQQMNLSLRRLTRSLAAFPCAQRAPASGVPLPPPTPGEAPFAKTAPFLQNVPQADQDTAKDLRERYEIDAGNAATAWKNAEVIRQGLAAKGMSLNAGTAASVDHLQLFLDQAADALRDHKWDDALASLQAVESETQKVTKAVGN
jgi:hypothetical protein